MKRTAMGRREFLGATVAAGAFGLGARASAEPEEPQPGLAIWQGDGSTKSSVKVAAADRVKILQVTDLHFHAEWLFALKDKRTLEDIKRIAGETQPDLLVVSGDLWHDNPDGTGEEMMQRSVAKMASIGLPWLYVSGNHDQMDDWTKGHAHITQAKNALYRGGPGGGNYSVDLTDATGKPLWQFVCLNSNRQGLGAAQHAWLTGPGKAQLAAVPAFAVAHIPLKQQADAWTAKKAAGVQLERVCNEGEDGSSLGVLRQACDVRGYFCGHDHVNDYSAVVDSVELIYGHATGHSGYGGGDVPKGAKLITLNTQSGSFVWESIIADGTRWRPEAGLAIDQKLDTPWAARAGSKA